MENTVFISQFSACFIAYLEALPALNVILTDNRVMAVSG
jgi:hypothetical protein